MRTHSMVGFAAVCLSGSLCLGGFTKIGQAPSGEHTQGAIMGTLYGGTFHKIGDDFFNGAVTLRRVDDAMSSQPAINMAHGAIGDSTDACWTGGQFTARPVAKFSNNSQSLGASRGGKINHLFDVTGYGYDINATVAKGSCMGEMMTFMRSGDSGTHSSDMTQNADGRDHMITYEVIGLNGRQKTWLMFWEDLDLTPNLPKHRTHSDFNDLVVELRATAIPLPAAVWAGGAVMGLAAVCRKRLRRLAGV